MDKNTVRLLGLALAVFNISAIIPAAFTIRYLITHNLKIEFISVMEMLNDLSQVWMLFILPFLVTAVCVFMARQILLPRRVQN